MQSKKRTAALSAAAAMAAAGLCASTAQALEWAFAKVADGQTAVQDGGGFSLTSITAPSFDGQNLAFLATVNGVRGVYTAGAAGIRAAAVAGAAQPGAGAFTTFSQPMIDAGRVAFVATGTSRSGVYLQRIGFGGPVTVADTATAIPGLGGTLFSAFDINYAPAVDGDSVAFAKITQGVFSWNLPGPTLTRVADQSTTIPGRGINFQFFSKPAIENGNVVFQGGRGSGGYEGVYTNLGGSLRAVANDLTALPGGGVFGTEGATWRGHSIANGKIQLYGLTGSSNYVLLNENSPGNLSLVAKGGTTLVPGTAEPILSGFYDQAYNGDSNVFAATALSSGPGLFSDRGGSLQKVLGKGPFDGKTITDFSFMHGSYAGRSFAFEAQFSDGSRGIYLATAKQAPPTSATLHPFTSGGVRDNAPAGSPDLMTQQFISRATGISEYRSMLDYDLLDYQGTHVASAHVRGTIYTNNYLDSGTRNIGIQLFSDDGVTDLADFLVAATDVGSVSYDPRIQDTTNFDIDITTAINGLLDSGARFGGLRFTALNDFAPSVLTPSDLPTLTITVPEPSGIAVAAVFGASVLLRRRRHGHDSGSDVRIRS